MLVPLYITSCCRIDNRYVHKNGELLLKQEGVGTEWLAAVYKHFGYDYPKFYRMDGLSKLGWLATELVLSDGYVKSYPPEDTGIVILNRSSSMDTDKKYLESVKTIASPALFVYTLPNIVLGEISIRHKLKGESALFVAERFDSEFMVQQVHDLFAEGSVESCICGWLEFFGNKIEAAVYFVEKKRNGISIPFTQENINKLYELPDG